MQKIKKFLNSNYLIYFIIVCVGIFWFFIAYQKYDNFVFHVGDTAIEENSFWNTIHGNFFYQSNLTSADNNFREHVNFSRFLYLPFYYIFPHTLVFFSIIQIMFIIAGIWLYRFALGLIGKVGAIISTALFLFNPLTAAQTVGPMHVVAICTPLFLFLLISYTNRNYKHFLIWTLVVLFSSEFTSPTIFMVGLLALWDRRGWKWYLFPMLSSIIFYFITQSFITVGASKSMIDNFKWDSLKEINKLDKRLDFVFSFLKPLLFITPFFSRYIILLIPSIIVAIFIIVTIRRFEDGAHIFSFIPAILAIIFIDLAKKWSNKKRILLYAISIIGIIITLSSYFEWMKIDGRLEKNTSDKAVSYVIDVGSVTSTPFIGTHLSRRTYFYLWENDQLTDYVILNFNKNGKKNKKIGDGDRYIDRVFLSDKYKEVFYENKIIVYIKKEKLKELLKLPIEEIEKMSQDDLQNKLLNIKK